MTALEFVVSTGTPLKATTAVRSHAVKSGLQRKCAAQEPGNLQDSQLVVRQKSTLKGRFRVSSSRSKKAPSNPNRDAADTTLLRQEPQVFGRTNRETQRPPHHEYQYGEDKADPRGYSLVKAPSQSWGDPFWSFPITQSQGVDNLIKYFLAYLDLNVSIAQISKLWWGFAVSDPLVLHTTLGIVAVEWGMMVPNPKLAYHEGFKQKALAIPGIQARLRENDLGDAVVGAIANLASMEGLGGDYSAALIHLKAVGSIVKARGGFSTFIDNRDFSTSVNWPDLVVAVGTGSKPMFPLIHDWDSVKLPASILVAAECPGLSHLQVFETNADDTSIRYSFSILRQAFFASRSGQVSPQDLRILFNSVDFQLANLIYGSKGAPARYLLLATAQIFVAYNVRDTHIECFIPEILAKRLVRYLQGRMEELLRQDIYWYGILWSFFTCFVSTPVGSEQWSFFRNALSTTMRSIGITEPMQLKSIAQRFIWDDDRTEKAFHGYQPILFPVEMNDARVDQTTTRTIQLAVSNKFISSLSQYRVLSSQG